MSTLLQDSFPDANGTSLAGKAMATGGPWSVLAGTAAVQSNRVEATVLEFIAVADAGAADVVVSATVQTTSAGTGAAAVVARAQDVNNLWLVNASFSAQEVQIYERVAGTYNLRAQSAVTLNASTDYTLQMTASGTSLSGTINGVTVNYTSSSLQTQTQCGFRMDNSNLRVDDFLATGGSPPPAAAPNLLLLGVG